MRECSSEKTSNLPAIPRLRCISPATTSVCTSFSFVIRLGGSSGLSITRSPTLSDRSSFPKGLVILFLRVSLFHKLRVRDPLLYLQFDFLPSHLKTGAFPLHHPIYTHTGGPVQAPFVLNVTGATFAKEVVEASKEFPVIVDFWAPWCGPCRALGPVLEKLAAEYAGRFRLAKVNSEENPEISRQFNVRSIPDVRAFRDGRQVDQFLGALPERQVRDFIESVVPSPAELERLRAAELRAMEDLDGATAALRAALELDPADDLARMDLAELLIETGKLEEAAR